MALVHMTRLEADANAHPLDISKQVALWNELVQYPAGQKRVLSRYERLMEFDKHSSLLRSPELFQMYIRALLMTNQAGAIDAAIRARDAILTLPVPESEPEPKPLTASQIIARDVVSAAAARPKDHWATLLRSRLTGTAMGSTTVPGGAPDDPGVSGGKGNPVHVILEERESRHCCTLSAFCTR
jgi:ATP-dependent metalloprotease